MRLLLDTPIFLWAVSGDPLLNPTSRRVIESADEVYVSAASIWEIAIKRGLGRADLSVDPRLLRRGLLDNGWLELPIQSDHVVAIDGLPPFHKDPFDRLLVAQSHVEGILLVTSDDIVAAYPGPIMRI